MRRKYSDNQYLYHQLLLCSLKKYGLLQIGVYFLASKTHYLGDDEKYQM